MKCPKCGYLGFETVDRCRNCGYDFSLTPTAALPELPMRGDPIHIDPLDDLSLIDAAHESPVPRSDVLPDLDRRPNTAATGSSHAAKGELPLFGRAVPRVADDEPLVKRRSPPRPPLAVRRAAPEAPRPTGGGFWSDLGSDVEWPTDGSSPRLALEERPPVGGRPTPSAEGAQSAEVGQRLVAVAIDMLILAAIDALVVYFTMQICGIAFGDLGILPRGPLIAFLLVQNGGYLVAFTAGGQTLGKMATGIRVVTADPSGSVDLGRAFLRTLVWMVLAVPAGLGFLTLLNRDRRGLHDRFAGTRVVRASA